MLRRFKCTPAGSTTLIVVFESAPPSRPPYSNIIADVQSGMHASEAAAYRRYDVRRRSPSVNCRISALPLHLPLETAAGSSKHLPVVVNSRRPEYVLLFSFLFFFFSKVPVTRSIKHGISEGLYLEARRRELHQNSKVKSFTYARRANFLKRKEKRCVGGLKETTSQNSIYLLLHARTFDLRSNSPENITLYTYSKINITTSLIVLEFDICVIFSHVDICFEKTGFEDQTKVYLRKSWLPRSCPTIRPGKFHSYLLFLSVLRISTDFAPLGPGSKVPVNVHALSTPISVLFWVSDCTVWIKYWRLFGHFFAQIWWTWRWSSILEFSSFQE